VIRFFGRWWLSTCAVILGLICAVLTPLMTRSTWERVALTLAAFIFFAGAVRLVFGVRLRLYVKRSRAKG
jgi:uncharacterized membrane protein HdeD (DUF308 family)